MSDRQQSRSTEEPASAPATTRGPLIDGVAEIRRVARIRFPAFIIVSEGEVVAEMGRAGLLRIRLGRGRRIVVGAERGSAQARRGDAGKGQLRDQWARLRALPPPDGGPPLGTSGQLGAARARGRACRVPPACPPGGSGPAGSARCRARGVRRHRLRHSRRARPRRAAFQVVTAAQITRERRRPLP